MLKQTIVCAGIGRDPLTSLQSYFSPGVFEFAIFNTAEELLSNIKKYRAGLVFLSNTLPDLKSIQELCIALRALPPTETVPIIVLTTEAPQQQEKLTLFHAGLIDGYFQLPLNMEELAAYACVFLHRQALQEELEAKNRLLARMSVTDELTQCYNRRCLINRFEEEIKRIKRYGYPLSAAMIDIDHFKKINDDFGHTHGDAVLKQLAAVFRGNLRALDIICRYGGEEFIILLPHIDYSGALLTAERLCNKVKSFVFAVDSNTIKITLSIGVITFTAEDDITVDTAISALDGQLYKAKNSGRDRVCGGTYKTLSAGT